MDFLDPEITKRKNRYLLIGYFLFGVLIVLGTVILVYLAYGYGLGKNGNVYQNGLIYVASTPSTANIKMNSVSYGTTSNRIAIQSGQYILSIKKSGYRSWQRSIEVDGGSVQHFDYPFLLPNILSSTTVSSSTSLTNLSIQSLDRRWLLLLQPGSLLNFSKYDLNTKPLISPVTISIPSGILSPVVGGGDSIKLVEWSIDNQHALLEHLMPSGNEYILFNIKTPADTINLNKTLNIPIGLEKISLWNQAYSKYYIYDPVVKSLYSEKLSDTKLQTVLNGVEAFKSYGDNIIIYASNQKVESGQIAIRLLDGTTNYNIRTFPSGSTYLLDMAQNNNNYFLIAGSTNAGKVYVYENPEQTIQQFPNQLLVPVDLLQLPGVNYVKFSADTSKILAENGTTIKTYDNFYNHNYSYILPETIDAPMTNVTWMDGERLIFISNKKVYFIDYDGTNQQKLVSNEPSILPNFNQDYKYLYTITQNIDSKTKATSFELQQTPTRLKADL